MKLSKQVQVVEKLYLMGNEEQLYRLISNLIVNAIQATPSGGKVTVFLERNERYALYWRGCWAHCLIKELSLRLNLTAVGCALDYL
jgi:signal transduction histidine kinase